MKITFIKDCPPQIHSGWSAYKEGTQADLSGGKNLIMQGFARDGWQAVELIEDAPKSKVVSNANANATESARKLANKHRLELWSVNGSGKGGKVTLGDVKALVE